MNESGKETDDEILSIDNFVTDDGLLSNDTIRVNGRIRLLSVIFYKLSKEI